MLNWLHIENIAVIEKAEIEFSSGLMVLTGETGVGKSIIIDSINMLTGVRLSKDLIRKGKDKALVEALFNDVDSKVYEMLLKFGIDICPDDGIIISRELNITQKVYAELTQNLFLHPCLKIFHLF